MLSTILQSFCVQETKIKGLDSAGGLYGHSSIYPHSHWEQSNRITGQKWSRIALHFTSSRAIGAQY